LVLLAEGVQNTMVDIKGRAELADAIRALAAGNITNDAFESRVPHESPDPAVHEVFLSGAWQLYSDLHTHRLAGRYRLPDAARPEVARWVLFLKSGRPYEWPTLRGIRGMGLLLASLLTLGLAGTVLRQHLRHLGDLSVWPFLRREDFESAKASHPPYMGGAA